MSFAEGNFDDKRKMCAKPETEKGGAEEGIEQSGQTYVLKIRFSVMKRNLARFCSVHNS